MIMGTAISTTDSGDSGEEKFKCGADHNCDEQAISSIRQNLLFPYEILEKVLSFLSVRDKLIAREVCSNWMLHINDAAGLQDTVKVRVNSDEILNLLSLTEPVYTRFYFHKIDLTRQSMHFWSMYNETITHLDFYDCSIIPRRTSDCEQPDFVLGCPNLIHLGLINCDKYFLMGGNFIQLHEVLHLGDLESLNLSRNKNLTDNILFSILDKTKKLKSLDLSDCINMVFMKAVHNRFYPSSSGVQPPCSDHILSFHTLCNRFLESEKAQHMKEFNFGMKFNSTGMDQIIANDIIKWEGANLESPELKAVDLKQFINKFHATLVKLKLGRCKLSSEELFLGNLNSAQEFSLHDSRSITDVQFLKTMPYLRKLVLDGISGFEFDSEAFAGLRFLVELSINGIKPFGDAGSVQIQLTNCFKYIPNLTSLDVGNCAFINDEILQKIIKKLKRLKCLNLESTSISDIGLAGVSKLECMQRKSRPTNALFLEISNNDEESKTKSSGFSLAEITDLEDLNLSYCCDIGDITCQNSIKFNSLTSLNLSNCSTLSKQGLLSIINNCRSLEKLVLMHCSRQILTDPEVIASARETLYRCREITY